MPGKIFEDTVIVLLSTYNGEKYLPQQLDSIMGQKGVSVRLLCRDDGSSDSTAAILADYRTRSDGHMEIISGHNVGYAESFSELIREALTRYPEAQYFAFADQDDVWLDDKLKAGVDSLKRRDMSRPQAYCTNTDLVDTDLNHIGYGWTPGSVSLSKPRAMIQSFATGCTLVFNRRAAELYDAHRPAELKVHDFLIYQICMFLGNVEYDDTPRILYRQHTSNQIGKPGFLGRMRRRLRGHFKDRELETQDRNFLQAYGTMMEEGDRAMLSDFVDYRKSAVKRLRLLFSRKIRYTVAERNFFFIIKIIIGRV